MGILVPFRVSWETGPLVNLVESDRGPAMGRGRVVGPESVGSVSKGMGPSVPWDCVGSGDHQCARRACPVVGGGALLRCERRGPGGDRLGRGRGRRGGGRRGEARRGGAGPRRRGGQGGLPARESGRAGLGGARPLNAAGGGPVGSTWPEKEPFRPGSPDAPSVPPLRLRRRGPSLPAGSARRPAEEGRPVHPRAAPLSRPIRGHATPEPWAVHCEDPDGPPLEHTPRPAPPRLAPPEPPRDGTAATGAQRKRQTPRTPGRPEPEGRSGNEPTLLAGGLQTPKGGKGARSLGPTAALSATRPSRGVPPPMCVEQ